jgi:SAM-dependent methyltransferase
MRPMQASFDRTALPYWEARSSHWRIVPPLSPGEDDVRFYEARAGGSARGTGMDALLLGVTAPIAAMRWPAGTRLVSVDWARGMFRHVWPRESAPAGAALVCGDWRELPLASASIDFAVGDGCYSVFRDLAGPAAMNREMRRVLREGGELCLRCFRRPDAPASVDSLFADLLAGRIRNLDLFRWLLAMALQGASPHGVSVHAVWREWHARVPDPAAGRERWGWSDEAVANLERWRSLDTSYTFPTLAEIERLAAPHFDVVACDLPAYEFGAQFPRLVMRARAGTR